jgi:hypothetical protein
MSGAEHGQSPPVRRWTGEPAEARMLPYASSRKSDNRRREVRSGFALGPAAAMTCRLPPRLRTRAASSDRARGRGRTRGRAEAQGQRARAPLFPFASNATSLPANALSPRQESRSEVKWYFRNRDDEQVWRPGPKIAVPGGAHRCALSLQGRGRHRACSRLGWVRVQGLRPRGPSPILDA